MTLRDCIQTLVTTASQRRQRVTGGAARQTQKHAQSKRVTWDDKGYLYAGAAAIITGIVLERAYTRQAELQEPTLGSELRAEAGPTPITDGDPGATTQPSAGAYTAWGSEATVQQASRARPELLTASLSCPQWLQAERSHCLDVLPGRRDGAGGGGAPSPPPR